MLDSCSQESDIAAMRRLMLLRHAKTERPEPGERDRDRKLTARGRSDAPVIGAYMTDNRLFPDLVLVSPAIRARETWTLLAVNMPQNPRVVNEERIYNASAEKLIAIVGETNAARSLLVIGHNPGLHDLAVQLVASGDAGAREHLIEKLPTAGLVVIDLDLDDWTEIHPRAGRLERFVSPRIIAEAME